MFFKKPSIALVVFVLLLQVNSNAQKAASLARSTPEEQGVSSAGIAQFITAETKSVNELHGFVMLRHGKVIAEGWSAPYAASIRHTMYSTSKSFTSTAVGFAVSEHLLSLSDKVVSFFPNDLPDSISPYLAALTVKDVITMSDGQEPDPTFSVSSRDTNWVRSFLALPILHAPGSTFLYNSLGTYMLSAIVQKVTGQKVIDYLRPRLFDPLGITGIDWEVDPRGINVGGWGLRLKTEDMAKFGQLLLQKGMWEGKQVIPSAWVEEATTSKIIQHPDWTQEKRDSSDWEQGYCYQFWRCRHNAFRADGAFGQYIIVMPELDAVVAITSETPNMQDELNLVWKYLLPAMQSEKLPGNKAAYNLLVKQLSTLAVPVPPKSAASLYAKNISGITYTMTKNDRLVNSLSFTFNNKGCLVNLKTDTSQYKILFGGGYWAKDETTKRGASLTAAAKGSFVGLPASKIAASYTWLDNYTLELVLRYIESPHRETYTCKFDNNTLTVEIHNSFEPPSKITTLTGTKK